MEHHYFTRDNIHIDVIIIDKKDGSLREKTRGISLDALYIKSGVPGLKKNAAVELAVTVNSPPSNDIQLISGFVMRKSDGSVAIIFSEYNNEFSRTIRKKLGLPRASLIAYSE